MSRITLERAQAAKKATIRRFKNVASVTGVGITRVAGEYAVKLNLSEPLDPEVRVPADVDGVPLRIEVIGTVRSRSSS